MERVGSITVDAMHPGKLLKNGMMKAHGLSEHDLVEITGMASEYIHALLNGKTDMTEEMDNALSDWLGVGHGSWMNMQRSWKAELSEEIPVMSGELNDEYTDDDRFHDA